MLVGCDCQNDVSTYTGFTNNLIIDIDIEFRYFNGKNTDGSLAYIYGNQTVYSQGSALYLLKVETRTDHGSQCIHEASGVVGTISAPIQFSLSSLSQYTICDSSGIPTLNGGQGPRYQLYQLGASCGEFRRIDISEGY